MLGANKHFTQRSVRVLGDNMCCVIASRAHHSAAGLSTRECREFGIWYTCCISQEFYLQFVSVQPSAAMSSGKKRRMMLLAPRLQSEE